MKLVVVSARMRLLPLRLGAVLPPAHLIDGAEPELIGPGRCEPAHRYLAHHRIDL